MPRKAYRVTESPLLGVVLLLAAWTALGALAQDAAQVGEIKMTAKKYEFAPNVIAVRKGERVKLVITAT